MTTPVGLGWGKGAGVGGAGRLVKKVSSVFRPQLGSSQSVLS